MSEKQTRCPNCSSIYKVTVTQLTVAQGMVCCPKCTAEFNALLHLIQPKVSSPEDKLAHDANAQQNKSLISDNRNEMHLLDIFNRKIENSNITLRTYLNNLNSFNNEPVTNFPTLNLSSDRNNGTQGSSQGRSIQYYAAWSLVNFCLIFVLIFQVLWFNPNYLQRSPLLNAVFINTCNLFNCQTIDQRYTYIEVEQIKVRRLTSETTQFSGVLINHYENGLELPLIKVSLIKDGVVKSSSIQAPSEYLIESLSGITRIPTDSPYKFKFTLNVERNSFDTQKIEVIRP